MQNLRYKILFVMSVFLTGTQTILGAINASEYYTYYTREFLGNLGQRNPSAVPIRKMSRNDQFYDTAAGYANGTAIYLNEDLFEGGRRSDGINLFTCAHEAAHHALRHPYQTRRNGLEIEQEADETAARMLCTYGYRWVVEEEVALLRQLVNAGQGHYTDGAHPTTQQQYVYLRRVLDTRQDRNPNPAEVVANRNANNARPERNANNVRPERNRNNTRPERNSNNAPERNPVREHKPSRPVVEEIKDLLKHFNNLSREQKIVIAGIVGMRFVGWL